MSSQQLPWLGDAPATVVPLRSGPVGQRPRDDTGKRGYALGRMEDLAKELTELGADSGRRHDTLRDGAEALGKYVERARPRRRVTKGGFPSRSVPEGTRSRGRTTTGRGTPTSLSTFVRCPGTSVTDPDPTSPSDGGRFMEFAQWLRLGHAATQPCVRCTVRRLAHPVPSRPVSVRLGGHGRPRPRPGRVSRVWPRRGGCLRAGACARTGSRWSRRAGRGSCRSPA